MNIDKINIAKNSFWGINKVEEKQANKTSACPISQAIISKEAAQCIKSMNMPSDSSSCVFLKNVNIPYLNLNGNLYVLPNGQKCFIAKKEGPCTIKTCFKVGSMNETDNIRGISHFIEHNLFNGSKNLKPNEFVENINRMGGRYNASTGFIGTDYYINSPLHNDEDIYKFIKMHAGMLTSPDFTEDMLLKEKGPVISEIQMYEDSPSSLATNTVLKNLLGINTVAGDLVGGSVKNIENLTRDDVVDYYKKNYNPKTALTIVVGDVDEKKILKALSENFADFKTPVEFKQYHEPFNPIQKTVRQDLFSKNAQASVIQLAFACNPSLKEQVALNILLTALTGYNNAKLSKALRNINLEIGSSVEKIGNNVNDYSAILFSTTTPNNNEEDVLKTIYSKIHEMAYIPLTNEELKIAKDKITCNNSHIAENNSSIVSMLATNYLEGLGIDSLVDYEKILQSITKEDIKNAAKKLLDLNKASICVVHPQKTNNVSFGKNIKTDYDIKMYRTPNNANIATLNLPESKLYALNFALKTDKTAQNSAIPVLLDLMLKKGTSLMSEEAFINEKDKKNIESYITVRHKSCQFEYVFPKESLTSVLDVLHKNIYFPDLNQKNLDDAKQKIKNLYFSIPKGAENRANEEIYKDSPAGLSLRKICEMLDKVTLNDVINYYNELIYNPECKITLSGNLDDKQVLNTLYQGISNNGRVYSAKEITNITDIPKLEKNVVVTDTQERNQADVVQVFSFKESGNVKDRAALLLLNTILGGNSNSRLFQDLREKQKLAYHVSSSYSKNGPEDNSAISLKIGTTTENPNNPNQNENLKKSLLGFKKHIERLLNEKVSQAELDAAKLQIKSSIAYGLESTLGKNIFLTSSMHSLYKSKYMENLLSAIDYITPEHIKKIAQYCFNQPSVISIVASKNTIDKSNEFLKTLGEVKNY